MHIHAAYRERKRVSERDREGCIQTLTYAASCTHAYATYLNENAWLFTHCLRYTLSGLYPPSLVYLFSHLYLPALPSKISICSHTHTQTHTSLYIPFIVIVVVVVTVVVVVVVACLVSLAVKFADPNYPRDDTMLIYTSQH